MTILDIMRTGVRVVYTGKGTPPTRAARHQWGPVAGDSPCHNHQTTSARRTSGISRTADAQRACAADPLRVAPTDRLPPVGASLRPDGTGGSRDSVLVPSVELELTSVSVRGAHRGSGNVQPRCQRICPRRSPPPASPRRRCGPGAMRSYVPPKYRVQPKHGMLFAIGTLRNSARLRTIHLSSARPPPRQCMFRGVCRLAGASEAAP